MWAFIQFNGIMLGTYIAILIVYYSAQDSIGVMGEARKE